MIFKKNNVNQLKESLTVWNFVICKQVINVEGEFDKLILVHWKRWENEVESKGMCLIFACFYLSATKNMEILE